MKNLVIALGAAGVKCGIGLVESGIIPLDDVKFINSTLKDIPTKYKEYAIRISQVDSGAAQERSRGKEMTLEAIKDGRLKLDGICEPYHQKVILLTSLSGGTGSGSSVVIAKYLKDVVGIPVEIYGMVGFKDESVRALRNTIEFCQDLEGDYIIQLVRNDAFMAKAYGNRLMAEELANKEIAKRILIDSGDLIQESVQNIDDMDLFKLATTPGYKTVEYVTINEKIKSHEQFNYLIKNALDNSASIDPDAGGMKRLGMIFNLDRSSQAYIDYSYDQIRERLGVPYEVFNHVQDTDGTRFIAVVATGMKLPIDTVNDIYKEYQHQVEAVDVSNDDFFEQVRQMKGDKSDNMFDMDTNKQLNQGSKEKFFSAFEEKQPEKSTTLKEEVIADRHPKRSKADFLAEEF